MNDPLQVVLVEDNEADVALLLHELRRAGFQPAWHQVATAQELVQHLRPEVDIVLLDYSLPLLKAPEALRLVVDSGLDIPAIVVSGSIDEEVAVECMRLGASDYLFKDRLARLGDAVRQAIQARTLRAANLRAQAAVRENEHRFRSVAETAIDAVVITDGRGRIQYWNRAAGRMFGHANGQIIGKPLTSLLRKKDPPGVQAETLGLSEGQDPPGKPIRMVGWTRDGKEFPVELSLSEWEAEGEKHYSALIRDLTETLETQRRVQQQERLASIGQLAAGISHDFKNLLGAIILHSELVLGSLELSRKDEERVRLILGQAERGTYLIRQILDFSRRANMEPQPVDLLPFFRDLEELLAPGLQKSVRMNIECRQEHPIVIADPTRLQQVFMNLALNAADAMPKGGELRFVVDGFSLEPGDPAPTHDMAPGRWIRIRVSDTGVGISADDLPRVFDPFFTTKPAGEGTGLGLAQVYGIVKQHGGHIEVQSRLGEGTEFGLYFPTPTEKDATESDALRRSDGAGRGEVILVVDDDESFRRALASTLQALGYVTILAGDGRQALKLIEAGQREFDAVLTDLAMPGVGGADLFDRMQKRHPEIPLLLMSGYPLGSDTHQLLEAGSIVWLQKPLSTPVLARTLREVIDRKR